LQQLLDTARAERDAARRELGRMADLVLAKEREVEQAFRDGHQWGFEASGEGWNGEYPEGAVHHQLYAAARTFAVKRWHELRGDRP
jgi:hypothetical protein